MILSPVSPLPNVNTAREILGELQLDDAANGSYYLYCAVVDMMTPTPGTASASIPVKVTAITAAAGSTSLVCSSGSTIIKMTSALPDSTYSCTAALGALGPAIVGPGGGRAAIIYSTPACAANSLDTISCVATGCMGAEEAGAIHINLRGNPTPLAATIEIESNPVTVGGGAVTIICSASGGTEPYTYSIAGGACIGSISSCSYMPHRLV